MQPMNRYPALSLLCLCALACSPGAFAQQKKTYYYHQVTKDTYRHSSTADVWRDDNNDGINDADQPRRKTTYYYSPHYRDRHLYSPYRYQPNTRYYQPAGHKSGSWWGVGSRLPAVYYGPNYMVDYRRYRLPEPRQGDRWVRVENDVYLVNSASGQIRDALYELFY
jgi:Ni/Co efflux regulator RcnB